MLVGEMWVLQFRLLCSVLQHANLSGIMADQGAASEGAPAGGSAAVANPRLQLSLDDLVATSKPKAKPKAKQSAIKKKSAPQKTRPVERKARGDAVAPYERRRVSKPPPLQASTCSCVRIRRTTNRSVPGQIARGLNFPLEVFKSSSTRETAATLVKLEARFSKAASIEVHINVHQRRTPWLRPTPINRTNLWY
jgi:hypothetical protein